MVQFLWFTAALASSFLLPFNKLQIRVRNYQQNIYTELFRPINPSSGDMKTKFIGLKRVVFLSVFCLF